jgi:branched-chain amino acid transport system ATP-binding protein
MTPPLLEMRNIETYYGPIMAIRGVSLIVEEGEIVTVLGANGAGKTTLLKTATGALDSNKGQVLLDGHEIQCRDPDWVARQGIAHVPEGREVFPFLTVAENLAMGAYNRRDKKAILFPGAAQAAPQDVDVSFGRSTADARNRARFHGAAAALVARRTLTGSVAREIFDIITRLNQEQGLTILLVEQNANVALNVSQRGYVMEVGGMVMDGPSDKLLDSEDIKEFYLGKKDEGVRGRRRWKKRKTWR